MFSDFSTRYIIGKEALPYEKYFAYAGIAVEKKIDETKPYAADGRHALRRPRGGLGVVGQLDELRAGRHVRPEALDVIGKCRRADREYDAIVDEAVQYHRDRLVKEFGVASPNSS